MFNDDNAGARARHTALTTIFTMYDGAPSDPVELAHYLHEKGRRAIEDAERAIADALPPIDEHTPGIDQDRDLEGDVEAWRARMYDGPIDVTDLAGTGEEDTDGDTWEIIGGSTRYVVREVQRYRAATLKTMHYINDDATDDMHGDDFETIEAAQAEAERLNAEADPVFVVWDTEEDERADIDDVYDAEDETEADEVCAALNLDDYRANTHGWPFAHNYAWIIPEHDAEDFRAAGFVVARYKGDTLYAGIDGGGYSFMGQHWIPLYLRRAGANGWYVRTTAGLRRVAPAGGAK